jgi:hypothetical protein
MYRSIDNQRSDTLLPKLIPGCTIDTLVGRLIPGRKFQVSKTNGNSYLYPFFIIKEFCIILGDMAG